MEVHFSSELQSKLDETARAAGRNTEELVKDVMAEYVDELAEVRQTIDRRYDEITTGKVKPIDGEEAFSRLRLKSTARRGSRS